MRARNRRAVEAKDIRPLPSRRSPEAQKGPACLPRRRSAGRQQQRRKRFNDLTLPVYSERVREQAGGSAGNSGRARAISGEQVFHLLVFPVTGAPGLVTGMRDGETVPHGKIQVGRREQAMDLKIGISIWFAGVVVAVWAYWSNRRRARKARKIAARVSEIPPRQVLKAYERAMQRERATTQTQAAAFSLGVALAARGGDVCADCMEGVHEMAGNEDCACVCHGRPPA